MCYKLELLYMFAGRFDEDVIIERMRSAQDMLNFVGQRHYMVSHAAFKRFFEVVTCFCELTAKKFHHLMYKEYNLNDYDATF